MSRPSMRLLLIALAFLSVGAMGILALYLYDPAASNFYPRCLFRHATGLLCPGCGTARALHCLLHLRFAEAWRFNPAAIVAIPVIVGLLVFRRHAHSPIIGWGILVAVVAWCIGRNIIL